MVGVRPFVVLETRMTFGVWGPLVMVLTDPALPNHEQLSIVLPFLGGLIAAGGVLGGVLFVNRRDSPTSQARIMEANSEFALGLAAQVEHLFGRIDKLETEVASLRKENMILRNQNPQLQNGSIND